MTRSLACLASLSLLASGLFSCADTDGRFIRLAFRFAAVPEANQPLGEFDTDTGFHVVLTEARVALGPVYVYRDDRVALRSRKRRSFARLFGPSVARAHGGVDPLTGHPILGQMLEQLGFDALSREPVDTLPTIGTFGLAKSLTLELAPPSDAIAEGLHGHHAYVEGLATRDGITYPFAGGIDLAENGTLRRVENVALAAPLEDGLVTVHVHPARFLRGARFDLLPAPGEDGIRPIVPGSQVAGAFSIGLRSPASYEAHYTQDTP
jgi:hypothetical protein